MLYTHRGLAPDHMARHSTRDIFYIDTKKYLIRGFLGNIHVIYLFLTSRKVQEIAKSGGGGGEKSLGWGGV